MEFAVILGIEAIILLYLPHKMNHWKWSSCSCGRSKVPWFGVHHHKEYFMVTWAVVEALLAVVCALYPGHLIGSILWGFLFVLQLRTIHEHRKGKKKSILGRLLGWVAFNQHGRLVVVNK